jgi:epoxyqueuosine reductase
MTSETLLQWAKDEELFPAAVCKNRFSLDNCRSLLVVGLVYGNISDKEDTEYTEDKEDKKDEQDGGFEGATPETPAFIAPFARRNYYRAAVQKLQHIAQKLREEYGGKRADYRIYCNSQVIDEKRVAFESGLANIGRNTLLLTKEYGSLFVTGILTLPFGVEDCGSETVRKPFALCAGCDPDNPPCKTACPTGAITGEYHINKERCIQWYLSGHPGHEDTIPAIVKANWCNRLYGCTLCQDACIYHKKPIRGVRCAIGALPAVMDAQKIAASSGEEVKRMFHGTALGLSWLCPDGLKRNAKMCLKR